MIISKGTKIRAKKCPRGKYLRLCGIWFSLFGPPSFKWYGDLIKRIWLRFSGEILK
jgi:hypothetical protein